MPNPITFEGSIKKSGGSKILRIPADFYKDKTIQPLIAYPAEPGWDVAIGIRSFRIKSENIHGNKAEVVVEYDIDPAPLLENSDHNTQRKHSTQTGLHQFPVANPVRFGGERLPDGGQLLVCILTPSYSRENMSDFLMVLSFLCKPAGTLRDKPHQQEEERGGH